MFSIKNISAAQVAALACIPIAALSGLGIMLVSTNTKMIIGAAVAMGIFSYLLILFLVRRFIQRRIKLIYKLIYQTKATKKEEFYYKNLLPQKTVEEVNEDVETWAQHHTEEIEILKNNEAYRKEFLLNLSHELKTPIFAIQGYVDTLLNGALTDPAVNTKFLTNASRNVDRLVSLIRDLDGISRLEMGEQSLYPENFVIQDVIREIFESLSINAVDRQITFSIKKGCENPVMVYADKERIRQVLINLVDNALKYGKQNGNIEASIYKVDGKRALIEISDDGAGIGEEHLPRIFERFYRTDLARNRKIGGSGLGLSICKHIIEAHGQTIHVRSKIDVGSSFGFTLSGAK